MSVASAKKMWNDVIAKDLQGHGTKIFVNFVSKHHDQKAYFKKFSSVDDGALASNADLAKQALAVMKTLNEYMNAVDDAGKLKSMTTKMAADHKKMNVTGPNFQKLFGIITDYAVAAGGDKASWEAALKTIGDTITAQQ